MCVIALLSPIKYEKQSIELFKKYAAQYTDCAAGQIPVIRSNRPPAAAAAAAACEPTLGRQSSDVKVNININNLVRVRT